MRTSLRSSLLAGRGSSFALALPRIRSDCPYDGPFTDAARAAGPLLLILAVIPFIFADAGLASASAPPAAAGPVKLAFTPLPAALGGFILGAAAVAHHAVAGRVLGFSGIARAALTGAPDRHLWRFFLLIGMVVGGLIAPYVLLDGANASAAVFDSFPPTYSYARAAVGGLQIGVGTALGNGCTVIAAPPLAHLS